MKFAFLLVLLPSLVVSAQESAPPLKVSYTVDVQKPASGTVGVEMLIEDNRADVLTVGIPTWAPGSYRTVEYFKAIQGVEAEVDGKPVEVLSTPHKSLWKVKAAKAPKVRIKYGLTPANLATDKGKLTADHYELQGPSAYLFVLDHLKGPHQVTFKLPEKWKVGTGLTKLGEATYGARDYDTFIDCPTELGAFELATFEHEKVKYEIVLHASGKINLEVFADTLKKIVAEQVRMMGPAPFDRYVFIYHLREQFGGAGLEHLNSTHIAMPIQMIAADPVSIASITSHEFFHLWNVKRIRPVELGPFDYTQPVRSKALWLSEGGTSYFGDRTLVRAGIWKEEQYFTHLSEEIKQLQENPARKTQAVEEASRTVWDKLPSRVDYYNKGELLCLLLDLKLRVATKGKKGMDDVMRHIYKKYVLDEAAKGGSPIGVGFEEGGIAAAVKEIAGEDWGAFFRSHVAGVEELPYDEVFAAAGLKLTVSKSKALGLTTSHRGLRVTYVDPGSEPDKAGVKVGDRLIEVGGVEVANSAAVSKEIDKQKVGDKVKTTFARGDDKVEIVLPVQERSAYALGRAAELTELQRDVLSGWLGKQNY